MKVCKIVAACAVSVSLSTGCGGGGAEGGSPTATALNARSNPSVDNAMRVAIEVLSSSLQYVSGGDARIAVRAAPALRDKLELWLNGARIDAVMKPRADGLEGLITGLVNGDNTLKVRQKGHAVMASVQLTNYPSPARCSQARSSSPSSARPSRARSASSRWSSR